MALDYNGELDFYQNQLKMAGITKEMLDVSNFVGLTSIELQRLVDAAIKYKEGS